MSERALEIARKLLRALLDGGRRRSGGDLRGLAALARRRGLPPAAAEDAVQRLAGRWVRLSATPEGRARLEELSRRDDAVLGAKLRAALRREAASEREGHADYHALQQHVRLVVRERGFAEGSDRPAALFRGGVLRRELVALAVGAEVGEDGRLARLARAEAGRSRAVGELTRRLADRYLDRTTPLEDAERVASTAETPELAVRRRRDGDHLALEARRLLSPLERQLLLGGWDGKGLAELASQTGLSLRTVERRLPEIRRKFGDLVAAHAGSRSRLPVARRALERLREEAAEEVPAAPRPRRR